VFEPGKCILCGLCVQITTEAREPLGLSFIGRGFDLRIGVPFDDSMDRALKTTAARCADACPTGAIALKAGRSCCPGSMDGS
jgi:NADH dehydrogenase/NADH:ubiquinone oxidoreductase subunit G